MDLVRDLLDKEVVDRNGREIGRVDSIVVEVRDTAGPRVTAIEIGPAVLAYRVHRVLGRWMAAFEHAIGIDEGRPLRIPFSDIIEVGDRIKADLAFGETPAATLEARLRRWMP